MKKLIGLKVVELFEANKISDNIPILGILKTTISVVPPIF